MVGLIVASVWTEQVHAVSVQSGSKTRCCAQLSKLVDEHVTYMFYVVCLWGLHA